ncbi:MAG: ATP-binding protein, partial [Bacteroidota bacterium]
DAVVIYDYETETIKDCNNAVLKLLGFSKEEFLQLNRFDLMPNNSSLYPGIDIHQFIRKDHHSKVIKGQTIFSRAELKAKDGHPIFAELNIVPISKGTSNAFVIVHDITQSFESQQKIKESERNYRALFDNAFDGILVYDCNEYKVLSCNLQLSEYLSTKPEIIVKESFIGFSPEYQSNGMKSIQYFDQIINKTKKRGKYETEWAFLEKNGDTLTSELISFLLPQKDVCQVIFIFKDITDRKEQEVIIRSNVDELNRKNIELKRYIESNKQLDNFAAIASHDLQAPLRTIHSYTQILQKNIETEATDIQRECMHFITSATSSMRHLIRDLRSFSKVDATKLRIRTINTKHMVEEVLSELKASIEYKNATVTFPEILPNILGDRIKLKQLLQNLFTNALKYTAEDVTPTVQLLVEENQEEWHFKIKDNGIGISKENQDRIFQLFTRLHAPEEFSGTGIGLSLCKKVAEQHFGVIGVASELGVGSTFYFTIPKDIQDRFEDMP